MATAGKVARHNSGLFVLREFLFVHLYSIPPAEWLELCELRGSRTFPFVKQASFKFPNRGSFEGN